MNTTNKSSRLLLVLVAAFLTEGYVLGQDGVSITTDPVLIQAINRANWEPGGKYAGGFGYRGTLDPASRTGQVSIIPTSTLRIGNFLQQRAIIEGNYGFVVRFSDHQWYEHAPFDDTVTSQQFSF